MQPRRTLNSLLMAAAFLPSWLAAPNDADAMIVDTNPFNEGAYARVSSQSDGHWVGWMRKSNPNCNSGNFVWHWIGPISGFTEDVQVQGNLTNSYSEDITEESSGTLCGWAMSAPIHNGHALYFAGGPGNDNLKGYDVNTILYGEGGNDNLNAFGYSNTRYFYAGPGDDRMRGCSMSLRTDEVYDGGHPSSSGGFDTVADENHQYSPYYYSIEDWTLDC